ncbi:MAG: membrane-bound lytic murein transglycosylase D [Candidatus Magnetoglobus multicellularis str. Araruama]|uniref:Membrane-bound lytic murein transglycosylase D n=1 Tax=Candidatus Magnetoglobus multicellularis str. Araruama TaxID=890399 RepID=A0A1V1P8W0_9BACT|nr:MAG: membrane-bound lytic murein transglycosylase D [Candidatus Magnetoglobus multicellularis str. Araruama]
MKHKICLILLGIFFLSATVFASQYFPEPPSLRDNITFWKKIYTDVSLKEGLLHDSEYPLVIFKKIYVGKRHGRSLSRYIKREKQKIKQYLNHVIQRSPEKWSFEEQRIADLYSRYAPRHALKRAYRRIRFQRGQRERFLKGLERSGQYIDDIRRILKKYNVPPELAYLPHVESSFNPNARSKAGASGLWQFITSTGRLYLNINSAVDERRDPILSTIAAAKLLRHNYTKLNSWPLAITAYNHGLLGMKRAVRRTGSRDISLIIKHHKSRSFRFASKNFYSCFIAVTEIDPNYKKYFSNVRFMPPLKRKKVTLSHYIRVNVLCDYLNVSKKVFKQLNPAIRSSIFRYNRHIPKGTRIFFPDHMSLSSIQYGLKQIPSKYKSTKPLMMTYTVRRGDYLGKIAKKTGVSAKTIARANNMRLNSRIHPGQRLYIPTSSKSYYSSSRPKYNATTTYRVRSGDYLDIIAKRTGVSSREIARANNMRLNARIYPGQRLKIPSTKSYVSGKKYRVKKGDFLGKIASRTGVSVKDIARANGLHQRSRIYPGQILTIPGTNNRTYRVKRGDYLGRISKKTGVSVNRILQENNISRHTTLYPGQILILPDNG